MNMQCPQCGSAEFRKLSLVYAEGVSKFKAHSRGWGNLFGSGGASLLFGRFKTKGEIQTSLSRNASPPRKCSYWRIIVWGLIGLPVLDFALGITSNRLPFAGDFVRQVTWFGLSYLAVLALILAFACSKNFWEFPKRHRLWDRSFICRSCGRVLQLPQASDASSQPLVREARS
jgi:hypothetical protein